MMREEDTGVIPVVDYGAANGDGRETRADHRLSGADYGRAKLLGLITDRDIVMRAVAEGKDCSSTRAEEVMTTDVYTARPHDRVVDVIRKMGDKQVRRIPVVSENGNLRGIISMADIAVETEADRELAEALEDISKESSFWGKIFG
jgi:CBS domain-containing protein